MNNKKMILVLSVLFFTTTQNLGMELYQSICGMTTQKHETKLTQYMKEANVDNVDARVTFIKGNFQKYGMQLKKKEQEACDHIRTCFTIPEQEWTKCQETIHQLKMFNRRTRNLPLFGIKRDPCFPDNIKLILETELLSQGINPQRINFECGCTAPSRITFCYIQPCWERKDGELHIHEGKTIPGSIKINVDEFQKLSFEDQQALCIDVVEAIVQDEGITLDAMARIASVTSDQDAECIKKNCQFEDAQRLFLHNAKFYACLKNKQAAQIIKFHLINFFKESVTADDYALVSKIEWQWRARKALRKYEKYVALSRKSMTRSHDVQVSVSMQIMYN